ncbi:MAG: tRNA 2-thiouridine(34) synthase MnmA [Planctomycetes bacterium RBG_16_43_13]|nr:MAG: tRNA 2-thiouridine(34) synthase MnmA [Planctomycetes bacterium RBG_16_43_13]
MSKKRVLLAMSGGIDSSVSAYLLKRDGYDVVGVFMRNGASFKSEHTGWHSCCSAEDAYDARRTADILGIPFYILNFEQEFNTIINYFVSEYNRGRTPNPCVMCNKLLKFGKLFEYANGLDADTIATGHYARVEHLNTNGNGDRFLLKRGKDPSKDQSYALFGLSQLQLARTLFPVGNYLKQEVREIALRENLPAKDKPESQEICFIPDDNYGRLLAEKVPENISEGIVRTMDGKVVGKHSGYQLFTIGQRKGLGIALGKPAYVVDINAEENTVTIGDDKDLLREIMLVRNVNWVSIEPPDIGTHIRADSKIRYNHTAAQSEVEVLKGNSVLVQFARPQRAVTPGQAAVFYQDDVVIGGGWIEKGDK